MQVLDPVTASTGANTQPGNIGTKPWAAGYFIVYILICHAMMTFLIATIDGTFTFGEFQVICLMCNQNGSLPPIASETCSLKKKHEQ